ncbi:MFS transporter [Paracoccus sp. NSM]|uniref:MFS transporter n=1 Tax=Paracoccus sp. NSM TaxID=3457784 RepID=UPI00403733DB
MDNRQTGNAVGRAGSRGHTDMRAGRANLVGASFALTALAYGLARFAYGLLLPQIRADLELDTVVAGWIGSAAFAAYCAGVVAAFFAVPRSGPRAVAVASGLCATLGMGLMAVAGSAPALGLAMGLAGISTGLASPPLAAAVACRVPASDRPRANGAINAGTAAGIILSALPALAFAEAWRDLYLGFAAIAAVVTLWLWRAMPGHAPEAAAQGKARAWPRGLVALSIAAALMGVASTAIWTFGADILRQDLDFDDERIALAWLIMGAGGLLSVATGPGANRFGLAAIHRVSLTLMALSMAALAAAPLAELLPHAAMGLFGAGYIVSCGALLLWGIALFPHRPDLGIGLPFLLIAIGQMIGAPLFGAALEAAGTPLALAGAGVALAVAAIPAPARNRIRNAPRTRGGLAGRAKAQETACHAP